MSTFDEFSFSAEQFSGTARLFPLPNLVLFPHVMQPLHVFEPRYRAMLEEALSDDRLITMGVLAPGWERDYEGRPPVWPVACLGRVVVSERLSGGAYNVLLMALRRVRLVRELPPAKSFREAVAEICEDRYPPAKSNKTAALKRKLRSVFLRILPELPQVHDQLDQLLGGDLSLGTLTDIISYMLDIGLDAKEALLAETNVHRRAKLLLVHLARVSSDLQPAAAGAQPFPPAFSCN
jgi:Lon protease-like protein